MKYVSKKNFGHGRSMKHAVKNAIHENFAGGSYGSQRTYCTRLARFRRYLQGRNIGDLRMVDRGVVEDYGRVLRDLVDQGHLAVSTAQHHLSSVNVLMRFLRHDELVCVSPSRFVGRRIAVAQEAPASLDLDLVLELVRRLILVNEPRVALAILFCRLLGARIMEASLVELRNAMRHAKRKGSITLTQGSKGNRAKKIPRVIEISTQHLGLIEELVKSISEQNVIPAGMTFRQWYDRSYRVTRPIAEELELASGFHDLRQAWACEKYKEITRCDAPCVAGSLVADRELDKKAREWLCEALGHGRLQVTASYIGGVR